MKKTPMSMVIAAAVLAASTLAFTTPAQAGDVPSGEIQSKFFSGNLKGSLSKSGSYVSDGDVEFTSHSGGKVTGTKTFADVARILAKWDAKGLSTFTTVIIGKKAYTAKGLPTVNADGSVTVRIATSHGTRIVRATTEPPAYAGQCPAGYTYDGTYDVTPPPTSAEDGEWNAWCYNESTGQMAWVVVGQVAYM